MAELKSVAALLGMSSVTLYQGLTTVSRTARGKLFKTAADAFTVNISVEIASFRFFPQLEIRGGVRYMHYHRFPVGEDYRSRHYLKNY